MAISRETASLSLLLSTLGRAHELLLDTNTNVVDRVKAVWPTLNRLPPVDRSTSWGSEWAAVSNRAAHLATAEAPAYTLAHAEEAGDIGSILLCLEWLIQRNLVPPPALQEPAQRS
jgi:hypothetical protein